MGRSPRWKVFDEHGLYRACFKRLDDAALFVSALGLNTTIRDGHLLRDTIWREGTGRFSASESCTDAVDCMVAKLHDMGREVDD